MNEVTHSMFQPVKERALQTTLALADPPKQIALTEKYRPTTFDDILGQPYAVQAARGFVDAPFPHALLFSGPSGVGKTTLAFAIANELGIDPEWNLRHIRSGEMDGEEVIRALSLLRQVAVGGGWRMLVCDEADQMSSKARNLWLSALESLQQYEYGKSVIIFTTNKPENFESRFRDRTEHIEFEGSPSVLGMEAQTLLNKLWNLEGLPGAPPSVERIPGVIAKDGGFPALSFRRVVRYVEQELRKPRNLRAEREARIASADSIDMMPRAFRDMRKVSL